jgi:hypothetical protein
MEPLEPPAVVVQQSNVLGFDGNTGKLNTQFGNVTQKQGHRIQAAVKFYSDACSRETGPEPVSDRWASPRDTRPLSLRGVT